MRLFLSILSVLLSFLSFSQSGKPYAIWDDSGAGVYRYVQMDVATGSKNNISSISGMLGFIAGDVSCIDVANNYYHFGALTTGGVYLFVTLDATTGAVLYSPVLTETTVGVEYNCADTALYALREISNNYDIVRLDPITAICTPVATIGFLNGYVGGSFSLNTQLGHYTFKAFVGSGYVLKTYDINTGLLIANVPFPDNVVGHKYSYFNNATYGLWEDAGVYKLERIDPLTGGHTTTATLLGVSPGFVSESQSVDDIGNYSFRGFDSLNNFSLFTVTLSSGSISASSLTTDNAIGFEDFTCFNSASSGVGDLSENNSFSVYPNPACTILNFSYDTQLDNVTIDIIDVTGRIIVSKSFENINQKAISLNEISNGSYIVRFRTENTTSYSNIIIVK